MKPGAERRNKISPRQLSAAVGCRSAPISKARSAGTRLCLLGASRHERGTPECMEKGLNKSMGLEFARDCKYCTFGMAARLFP